MLSVRLDTLDMNNSQIVCGLTMYTAWIPRNRWDCPRSATGLLLVDGISIIGPLKEQGEELQKSFELCFGSGQFGPFGTATRCTSGAR
jgi:hypothetical protein